MSKDASLLAAIRKNPDDDALRAQYAELLTTRGDPRGEYIAIQLRAARGDNSQSARESELANAHKKRWSEEAGARGVTMFYRRGFMQTMIAGGVAEILESREALRTQPITSLTLISLAGIVPHIEELAALPELEHLTELSLSGRAPDWQKRPPPREAMAALSKCTSLKQVRKLELSENLLDDAGAQALAEAPWLRTVEELVVMDNPELKDGFAALFPHLPSLRRLYARKSMLNDACLLALANSRMPLRDLYIDGCSIREPGVRALFASPVLSYAERVKLHGGILGDAPFVLAHSQYKNALRALELDSSSLSEKGIIELAHGAPFPELVFLDLSNNCLEDEAGAALAASRAFPKLEKLDLRENSLKDSIAALLAAEHFPALKLIGVSNNKLLSGRTRVVEWAGDSWEDGGSSVIEEKMTAEELQKLYVKRPALQVF